jgi:hypothetical protein
MMGRRAQPLGRAAIAVVLAGSPAGAVDLVEAVGAVSCGERVKSYAVDFLAPDNEALEANAKALVRELEANRRVSLSLDGRSCAEARCSFRASKGQTYRLVAEGERVDFDQLCIVISRP